MTLLRLVASLVYWSNKKRIRNVEDVEQAIQATSDNVDHELEELPGPGVVDDESTVNSYGPAPSFRYMPLLSGVIIPFSILLEIPGLTEHWYIRTEGNDIVDIKNNPSILDAGLGLSMASAVLANVCLLMRFMERRVKLMTLLCIFFLTVHGMTHILPSKFTHSTNVDYQISSTSLLLLHLVLSTDSTTVSHMAKPSGLLFARQ
jgi:hypothetical protein